MLATVVLLLHFAAPGDEALAARMQTELDSVFAQTPVRTQIILESRTARPGTSGDVIYVNVNRTCRPAFVSTEGALALTHSVDGVIQPLIEIDCAKVATFIRSSADLPRALARVLAHELLHYLLQEPCHAEHGIFQFSFTPFELTNPAIPALGHAVLADTRLSGTY